MKLRIKGDSLRLRIGPSELAQLLETGCIEESVHFGPQPAAQLTYALELVDTGEMTVRYELARLAVMLPAERARAWAGGEDVGVYGDVSLPLGRLDIAIEKDWACLDQRNAGNEDTFPNPKKC